MRAKPCNRCGETKSLEDFYRHAQTLDGHLNQCKVCSRKASDRWRRENIEKAREARKSYRQRFPEKADQWTREWRGRNPEKVRAHQHVNNALRRGRLTRPDHCEQCSSEASDLHAHHDDYSKPLEIRWLCPGCHGETHARVRTRAGEGN